MITATIPVQMATIETGTSTREQNTMSARPGGFARVARVLIAVGLTALLLWQSDPRRSGRPHAARIGGSFFLPALLVVVDRVLMAYRWWTLLAPWPT